MKKIEVDHKINLIDRSYGIYIPSTYANDLSLEKAIREYRNRMFKSLEIEMSSNIIFNLIKYFQSNTNMPGVGIRININSLIVDYFEKDENKDVGPSGEDLIEDEIYLLKK